MRSRITVNSNATNSDWQKAWSGRFDKKNAPLMERFNASISIDIRLWWADIQVNLAWAKALAKAGILTGKELEFIQNGLQQIQQEFETDTFSIIPSDEDIHMAIERRLTELIGEAGAKIHTGRSRNDQVVTDVRLYLKQKLVEIQQLNQQFQKILLESAEKHQQLIMPGYTHLQPAQAILFSHYLLSLFFALERDQNRLEDLRPRLDILPLGAGALAGSAYAIDRNLLASELGFQKISENSIDAISDRDFILEFVYILAQIQVHLSRYAEDLIIWSSAEFGFVELDEAWSTGSSMMPQKKNPDSLELIRGKTARVLGLQNQLFVLLKGLPLTYSKDLQEDKAAIFDAIDIVSDSLQVFTGVIESIKVNEHRMKARLDSALFATDLADYLVKKGIPFRKSHHLVGQVVRWGIENQCVLDKIPFEVYEQISPVFERSLYEIFDWKHSIEVRDLPGGTGFNSVKQQIEEAKRLLEES
jgi:argininosuccinate lyase